MQKWPVVTVKAKEPSAREIDVRISQECGIHIDFLEKMDSRVKPEDDFIKTNCRTNETAFLSLC